MPEKKLSCYSAVILCLRLLPKTAGYEPSKRLNCNQAKPELSLYPSNAATWLLSIPMGNGYWNKGISVCNAEIKY